MISFWPMRDRTINLSILEDFWKAMTFLIKGDRCGLSHTSPILSALIADMMAGIMATMKENHRDKKKLIDVPSLISLSMKQISNCLAPNFFM